MKIVHIVMSMLHGGSERLATDLSYASMNNGNDVTIVVLSSKIEGKGYDSTVKGKKLKIVYTDKKDGIDLKGISRLWKVLNEINPDVVHTHIDSVVYAIPWYIFNKSVAKIHTVHNVAKEELSPVKKKILKFGYKYCNIRPVAISERIRDTIIKEYDIQDNEIELIYNGIDLDQFNNSLVNSRDKVNKILHVGRFFPQKNHKFIVDAFELIIKEKPNLIITLVGEGPMYQEIKAYINDKKLSENIILVGATNKISKYYQESDLFILPSKFEGLPLSILEAYSFGLPVIATKVGGVEDILQDNENGILVEADDLDEFKNAVIKMIDDNNFRDKISKNNKLKAFEFNIDNVTNQYEKLYNYEIQNME